MPSRPCRPGAGSRRGLPSRGFRIARPDRQNPSVGAIPAGFAVRTALRPRRARGVQPHAPGVRVRASSRVPGRGAQPLELATADRLRDVPTTVRPRRRRGPGGPRAAVQQDRTASPASRRGTPAGSRAHRTPLAKLPRLIPRGERLAVPGGPWKMIRRLSSSSFSTSRRNRVSKSSSSASPCRSGADFGSGASGTVPVSLLFHISFLLPGRRHPPEHRLRFQAVARTFEPARFCFLDESIEEA